jgi:hypothetical protein
MPDDRTTDAATDARKQLRKMLDGLERLRTGQPRSDKPVYIREGDHLSVLLPPKKLSESD